MSDRTWTGVMVGAGFFAQFHADAWRRIPGVRIAAVADPLADRAPAFARQWNIPNTYSAAEEMLDREKPDFVDIVTRPGTHLSLTRMAAARGVHVVCQKPMAPTEEDCAAMVAASREAGVRLIIHENWRWQPWYREVRRLVDADRLGRPYHIAFRLRAGDGRGPEPYPAQPYFREMPRLLLYETIVHFLDTFRYLAGEIETVYCATARLNPIIAGEDYALIQLRFASGTHGVIDANRQSGTMPPEIAFGELRLEGERAAIRMTPDGDLWLTDYGQAETAHKFDKPPTGYKGDSVRATQQHIIECLESGRTAESEGEAYLRTVAAVEACYRSAASGQPERVR